MPYKDRDKRLQYHREYNVHHYESNKEKRKKQVRARRQKIKAWWVEMKKGLVCTDCGFLGKDNIWAMEFDHIDPNTKHRVISRMVGEGISIKRIQEEIAKCEPVCANCHRLRERKRYEEGKLNNKRSVDPHALSDQARRRNSEKRAKRRANKKKYTDRRPPGPKPKEIVPSTLEACVERYDEDEEWRVNADLNSL